MGISLHKAYNLKHQYITFHRKTMQMFLDTKFRVIRQKRFKLTRQVIHHNDIRKWQCNQRLKQKIFMYFAHKVLE